MTEEESASICAIQSGDKAELERFLTLKKGLANLATRPFFLKGADQDDLVQEATIGLVSAIMTFQIQKNDSFDAYAVMVMKRRLINVVKAYGRKKNAPLSQSDSLTMTVGEDEYEVDRILPLEDPLDKYLSEEENERFYCAAKRILTEGEFSILKQYLEGYSYREIAEHEATSAKNVDNTILKIKKKIKRAKGLFYDTELSAK